LGRRLYDVRKELCEQLNLNLSFCGRIPNYGKFKDDQNLHREKKKKEPYDPAFIFSAK
jgi:hypothetical protein